MAKTRWLDVERDEKMESTEIRSSWGCVVLMSIKNSFYHFEPERSETSEVPVLRRSQSEKRGFATVSDQTEEPARIFSQDVRAASAVRDDETPQSDTKMAFGGLWPEAGLKAARKGVKSKGWTSQWDISHFSGSLNKLSKLAKQGHKEADHELMSFTEAATRQLDDFPEKLLVQGFYVMAVYLAGQPGKSREGKAASSFARCCAERLSQLSSAQWKHLGSQGAANVLWAAGKLCNGAALAKTSAGRVCMAVAEGVMEGDVLQIHFRPEELSMALHGLSVCCRKTRPESTIPMFAIAALNEATDRVELQTDQGLSTIALAVLHLNLHERSEGQNFLKAAITSATQKMATEPFHPQAVSNLCKAVSKLHDQMQAGSFFEAAVTHAKSHEAKDKKSCQPYQWQDLAQIAMAIHKHARRPVLWQFANEVVAKAVEAVQKEAWISSKCSQHLLDIAYAGMKMYVDDQTLQCLGDHLASHSFKDCRFGRWQELNTYIAKTQSRH